MLSSRSLYPIIATTCHIMHACFIRYWQVLLRRALPPLPWLGLCLFEDRIYSYLSALILCTPSPPPQCTQQRAGTVRGRTSWDTAQGDSVGVDGPGLDQRSYLKLHGTLGPKEGDKPETSGKTGKTKHSFKSKGSEAGPKSRLQNQELRVWKT